MLKHVFTSIKVLFIFTLITGVLYPALVTVTAQTVFRDKANGSVVKKESIIIGSSLISQNFKNQKYFFGRPSAVDNMAVPSGASNLGFTSKSLAAKVAERKANLSKLYPEAKGQFPSDLIFASASGLDPHISSDAAKLQLDRIVKARKYNDVQKSELLELVVKYTEKPQMGFFGEERVNVLLLNLALDSVR